MTHRTARERLLAEAKDLPRNVATLDGVEGHTALLEPSPTGQARLIRVLHDGVEVCRTLTVEAGEARPPFYPDDVPFLEELSSTATWDDDVGLQVRWTPPSNKERMADILSRLADVDLTDAPAGLVELAQYLPQKSREERAELWYAFEEHEGESMSRWTRKMFGDATSRLLPAEVTAAVAEIVAFHEAAGWAVVEEGSTDGPQRTVRMERDSAHRVVQAISLVGITMLWLKQLEG